MKYIVSIQTVMVDVAVDADDFDEARELGRESFEQWMSSEAIFRVELAE